MYFPSTIDMTMCNLHSLSLSLVRHLVAAVYFLLVSCFILHWKYGVRYQVTAVITFLAEMKRMESERKERKNDDHAWLNFLFNSRCHLIFFFNPLKKIVSLKTNFLYYFISKTRVYYTKFTLWSFMNQQQLLFVFLFIVTINESNSESLYSPRTPPIRNSTEHTHPPIWSFFVSLFFISFVDPKLNPFME